MPKAGDRCIRAGRRHDDLPGIVNGRLAGGGAGSYIRTVDTLYFNSDGDIWCMSEIKEITPEQYDAPRSQCAATRSPFRLKRCDG